MEICNVETGLLKKKPCGETAVTHCVNCEQPLCAKHAVSQMSSGKKIFLCQQCAKAWKQSEKTVGALPSTPAAAKPAAAPAPKPAAAAPAPKPAPAPAPKPAAPAALKPAAAPAPKPAAVPKPTPVPPAAAPVEQKKQPQIENTGPLEFTLDPEDIPKKEK